MTDAPSQSEERGSAAAAAGEAPRSVTVETIKKRRDFLAAARARRWSGPGFLLQGRRRGADEASRSDVRVGYTCSKKVGDAVARNRAKRRLRAVAAQVLPRGGIPGWDYVLIGRADATATQPFAALVSDLEKALKRVHAPPKPKNGARR